MNTWLDFLTAGIFAIGFILSLVFLLLNKTLSSKLLGLYTFALAAGIAEPLILNYNLPPQLIAWYGGLSFLYGPLLFLYVSYALSEKRSHFSKDLFHFIPIIIYLLLVSLSPANGSGKDDDVFTEIILYELLFYQIFYYMLRSVRLWGNARNTEHYNQPLQIKLTFIKHLLVFSAVLFVSSFLFVHVFVLAKTFPFPPVFYTYIQLAFTFLILLIALLNTEMISPRRASV